MINVNDLYKLTDEPRIVGALQTLDYLQKMQVISAEKFLTSLPWEQMDHVESENKEEREAFCNWFNDMGSRQELGMELIDGQYTRQTMLEILFTKEELIHLHELVKKKNADRGYDKPK